MKEEEKKLFLVCGCGSEILVAEDLQEEKEINLAMFQYGFHHKPSWKRRIQVAWRYLISGTMYTDQIILSYKDAQRLKDFLPQENV